MKKFFLMLILFNANVAFGKNFVIYSFGELKVVFHQVNGEWVNKSCRDENCLALKMARLFKDAPLAPSDLMGGKNPRAIKCKLVMKGKVIIGLDKNRNQQSFCKFSDDSFLK